jgi:hypothetical protein
LGGDDFSGASSYPSLSIFNSEPYVGFKNFSSSNYGFVMRYTGGAWSNVSNTNASNNGIVGNFTALCVASNGYVYFAYAPTSDGYLYVRRNAGSWESFLTTADTLTGGKNPVDLFCNGTDVYLAYAKNNGTTQIRKYDSALSSWSDLGTLTSASNAQVSLYVYNNVPYIFLVNEASAAVVYYYSGSAWVQLGDSFASVIVGLDVYVDGTAFWVSYAKSNLPIVKRMLVGDTVWSTVGTVTGSSQSTRLVVKNGQPYLIFSNVSDANYLNAFVYDN